jgi:hypothetical protein
MKGILLLILILGSVFLVNECSNGTKDLQKQVDLANQKALKNVEIYIKEESFEKAEEVATNVLNGVVLTSALNKQSEKWWFPSAKENVVNKHRYKARNQLEDIEKKKAKKERLAKNRKARRAEARKKRLAKVKEKSTSNSSLPSSSSSNSDYEKPEKPRDPCEGFSYSTSVVSSRYSKATASTDTEYYINCKNSRRSDGKITKMSADYGRIIYFRQGYSTEYNNEYSAAKAACGCN